MKLARVLAVVSVFALGTSLNGCGSDGNAGTGTTNIGGPGGNGSTTASSLIDALCTAAHTCCVADGKASSKESCVTFYTAVAANAKLGATAGACESYLRQHGSDGEFCKGGLSGSDDVCEDALILNDKGSTPKRALGETCDSEDDCIVVTPGAEADCQHSYDGGSTKTACVELVTAKAGDACRYTLSEDNVRIQIFSGSNGPEEPATNSYGLCKFKDGLYCDSPTKTCKVFNKIGEPCTGFDSCESGASCVFQDGSGKQICVARAAVGEACSTNSSDSCVEGATCKDKLCVALKKANEACALSSECASSYCKDSKCEGNGGSSGGSGLLCFTPN